MYSLLKKIVTITSLLTLSLKAAIVWDPQEGWIFKGGVLESIYGEKVNVQGAWECMEAAKEAWGNENYRSALSLYKKVYTDYPESKLAAEAYYRAGKIYLDCHQYENSYKMFERIILCHPLYPRFDDVICMQFEIAYQLGGGARPYYWGIIPGLRDYSMAIKYFENIVTHAPYSTYAPYALMNIAELGRAYRKQADAVDALDRLISNYRHSPLAPKAYLMLAQTYADMVPGPSYDQSYTLKAINYYQDFLYLYPNDEDVACAEDGLRQAKEMYAASKLCIGDFYYKRRNNPCAARIYYNETISVAPDSDAATVASDRLELIAQGIPAKKTIVDRLFGRYKRLSTTAYLEELEMSKRDTESFEAGVSSQDFKTESTRERAEAPVNPPLTNKEQLEAFEQTEPCCPQDEVVEKAKFIEDWSADQSQE